MCIEVRARGAIRDRCDCKSASSQISFEQRLQDGRRKTWINTLNCQASTSDAKPVRPLLTAWCVAPWRMVKVM
jgi:hypothetical protein